MSEEEGFSYESPEKKRKSAVKLLILELAVLAFIVLVILGILLYLGVIHLDAFKPENINKIVTGERPGRCLILKDENCSKAQIGENPNFSGEKVAFFQLEPGNKIFSPEKGIVEVVDDLFWIEEDPSLQNKTGYRFYVVDEGQQVEDANVIYTIYTELKDTPDKNSEFVEKGQVIGSVGEGAVLSTNPYNLIVLVSKIDDELGRSDITENVFKSRN